MSLPKQLAAKSKSYGEKKDCAVKAIAIVMNASYEEAHAALKAAGRKTGRGTSLPVIMAALRSLGGHVNYVNNQDHRGLSLRRVTVNRVLGRARELRQGRWLVLTRDHILAVKDGEVLDWTEGRRHQCLFAWEVSL